MLKFCTYFNSYYLYKGVSMYLSLEESCNDFKLYVLCIDDITYKTLKKCNFKKMELIKLSDLEKEDKDLLKAKGNRNEIEYLWTLTPSITLYVMQNYINNDEIITYLDADLLFFNNPKEIFEEFGNNDIGVIEHRYSKLFCNYISTSGIFNVQFLPFRKNSNGIKCLNWWREKCNEWCYFKSENYKLGDQMYLNAWPYLFEKLHSIKHIGAGVGPWNIQNYKIHKKNNVIYIDEKKLIFYHFHGVNINFINNDNISLVFSNYYIPYKAKKLIYNKYLKSLKETIIFIKKFDNKTNFGYIKKSNIKKEGLKTKIFMIFEYIINFLYARIFRLYK